MREAHVRKQKLRKQVRVSGFLVLLVVSISDLRTEWGIPQDFDKMKHIKEGLNEETV